MSRGESLSKRDQAQTEVNRNLFSSWNFIDLNKILLQNEIDLLKRHWSAWKQAVKKEKSFSKRNNREKGSKNNQIMNQSFTLHHSTKDELYSSNPHDLKKKHHDLCWEDARSHFAIKSISAQRLKNVERHQGKILKMSAKVCFPDSKSCGGHNENKGVLNTWESEETSSTIDKVQDVSMSKIEKFLTSVKTCKMKRAKTLKCSHSVAHPKSVQLKRCDPMNVNHQGRIEEYNSITLQSKPFTDKIAKTKETDFGNNESNRVISSIKEAVNLSLAEAHTLLKSTIAASHRGKCTGRKEALKHKNEAESPLPPEMPVDDIVERMRVRELDRTARWQQSRERKERLESERRMKIKEEEKEKARQQQLLKKLKLLKFKEKKIEKMLLEKRNEEVRERFDQLNLRAQIHYNEHLLHKGLQSFVNELKTTATLVCQADSHHQKVLSSRIFSYWKNFMNLIGEKKITLAKDFYSKMVVRKCFNSWCKPLQEYTLNKQAAIDFYDMNTQEKAFVHWNRYTCDVMIELNCNYERADVFYNRCLLRKSFQCWRSFPVVMESERVRERIKNNFRLKVLEIFPDFSPQSDYEE